MNSAVFIAVTDRGEAGAAVWKLLNEYKGAAAFLRRRLQGEAARYRGLSLTATAHELFGVELSLTLPDRTTLAGVATNTDSGVWQSAGHAIGSIAETLQSLRRRCDELRERIATTDGELERLRAWDGQPAYDDALIELQVINAAFAAAEEQDKAARVGASIPAGEGTAAEVTAQTASTDEAGALATELLTLARTEGTGSGWDEWRPLIPLAPASLTWMAAELERQTASSALIAQPATDVHTDAGEVPQTSGAGELVRLHSKARVAFGDRVPRRHAQKPALPPHVECEREASQLALF